MKKLFKFGGFIALLIIISLNACKKDDNTSTDPTPSTSFFTFAKVGNVATYETRTPILITTYTGTMTQTIIEKVSDNIYKIVTSINLGIPSAPPVLDTSLWLISATEFANVDDVAGSNKFMYFAKNDNVNKTYTDSSGVNTRTILSINESVTTSAGVFSTYKIKETSSASTDESTYFISNTAGLVKMNTKTTIGIIGTLNVEINMISKNY